MCMEDSVTYISLHMSHMTMQSHAYEWVTSRILLSRVTRMHESCHTHKQATPTFLYIVIWLAMRVTCSCVWHDSCIRVTRLSNTRDVTHSYAWRDVTHSYAWRDVTRSVLDTQFTICKCTVELTFEFLCQDEVKFSNISSTVILNAVISGLTEFLGRFRSEMTFERDKNP